MRFGRDQDIEVRPVGGGAGCLTMLFISIAVSVVLTVALNLLIRL